MATRPSPAPHRTGPTRHAARPDDGTDPSASVAWARSGAMWLTGHPGRAPRWAPSALMGRLAAVTTHLAASTAAWGRRVDLDAADLLAGRAALLGLARRGRRSAGGSCRLLRSADGWVAVNLARPDDLDAVPAIVAVEVTTRAETSGTVRIEPGEAADAPWPTLARLAATVSSAELRDRCQLLGVPAAAVPTASATSIPAGTPRRDGRSDASDPTTVRRVGPPRRPAPRHRPLVVDLSSMWAGPLCAKLLGDAGARVVKVESVRRPDGARQGDAAFFDWLHAGHASVALDFDRREDRSILESLLRAADVVVESSRPRALAALGVDPPAVVASGAGVVWVRISGYGPSGPEASWVAFGDDAAAGAGLLARDARGGPVFCGDAIADPITGAVAAAAVADAVRRGGGELIDVAMVDAARWTVAGSSPVGPPVERARRNLGGETGDAWEAVVAGGRRPVQRPRPLRPAGRARHLGADTRAVVARMAVERPLSPTTAAAWPL